MSFITTERIPYVDFLSVTVLTRPAFLFRAPPLSYVSNIYYLPFEGKLWTCLIVLILLSTITVYITYFVSQTQNEHLPLSDLMLGAASIVCQIGSYLNPKRASGRIATVLKYSFFISI